MAAKEDSEPAGWASQPHDRGETLGSSAGGAAPGKWFAQYRIVREIGRGGMAIVYLAEDSKHARQVAIKVMRPEVAAAIGPDRFLREIGIAARLSHPHIVPLYDSGEVAGTLYYVMPFVDGDTLRDRLRRFGALAPAEATRLGEDVAEALHHAHEQGVVHRDIKPANILLAKGSALVADFGLASALAGSDATTLTVPGTALGTPAYMSPEQAAGGVVDGRSDLYSLGCVLFEMIAGRPPFHPTTLHEVLAQHITAEPPNLRELRPGTPRAAAEAVQRALAKRPEDRFQTGMEFAATLRERQPTSRARRRPAAVKLILAGLAAIAIVASVWGGAELWRQRHSRLPQGPLEVIRIEPPAGSSLQESQLREGVPIRVVLMSSMNDPDDAHDIEIRLQASSGTFFQDFDDGPSLHAWELAARRAPLVPTQLALVGTVTQDHVGNDGRIHLTITRWSISKDTPRNSKFTVHYSFEYEVTK